MNNNKVGIVKLLLSRSVNDFARSIDTAPGRLAFITAWENFTKELVAISVEAMESKIQEVEANAKASDAEKDLAQYLGQLVCGLYNVKNAPGRK